jgi:plasmid stability protein
MQRPRLPDDLARAKHARALRENRSGQNMLEQIVRAGLYTMDRTPPAPWTQGADSGASDDER